MLRNALRCLLLLALVTVTFTASSTPAFAASRSATAAKSGSAAGSKSKYALHQFTGVVTALDKESLTVEKGGKTPATRTFVRYEKMNVVGDLARDARVTVYYREESGKFVARKVVVKDADDETAAR